MSSPEISTIVQFCESMLERHGDNYLGVGWTKDPSYAALRYQVMLEAIRPGAVAPIEVLDFGCGASHLYEYILAQGLTNIRYSGLDLSPKFLELSRRKYPEVTYYQANILESDAEIPEFDYVLMNGVFNYKGSATYDSMEAYWRRLIKAAFRHAGVGIAFNVISKHVDWERDDLFHLPLEVMSRVVTSELSRHFTVRHDYGLYEYTVYVYRDPTPPPGKGGPGV